MGKKNPTSVTFRDEIDRIKDQLISAWGLSPAISAGLLLLSRLSDSDQKNLILDVKGKPGESLVVYTDSHLRKIIREEISAAGNFPSAPISKSDLQSAIDIVKSTVLKIPTAEERKQLFYLRKLLLEELKRHKETG